MGRVSETGINRARNKKGALPTRYISVLILSLFFLALSSGVAFAGTTPDTLDIIDVIAARNLAESGDLLIVAHYNIAWSVVGDYPDDPANETFVVQLLATDKSYTIASTTPYPFYAADDYGAGYDEGVISFYFSAAQVNILGLTWGDAYIVRLSTEPAFVTPIAYVEYPLDANSYNIGTSQADNQLWLKNWVLDTANSLTVNWGVTDTLTTVSVSEVLNEGGESYFSRVIYGLRTMCPDLYTANITSPTVVNSGTWTNALETDSQDQWDGTFVATAISGINGISGGNYYLVTNMGTIAMFVLIVLASIAFMPNKSARPGMMAGLLLPAVNTSLGFFEPMFLGLLCLPFIFYLGNQLFTKVAG